jgi:hypothetical protein
MLASRMLPKRRIIGQRINTGRESVVVSGGSIGDVRVMVLVMVLVPALEDVLIWSARSPPPE